MGPRGRWITTRRGALHGVSLVALSAVTGTELQPRLPVGRTPAWITSKHDGSKVHTLNFLSDEVTVVDTATWSVNSTFRTGSGSQGIIGSVTPDDTPLYVTNHGISDLIAIDTASNEVVQTIPLGGRPVGVSHGNDGTRVYTTDFGAEPDNEPVQLNYVTTGQYTATGNGEVSVFDVAYGTPAGASVELDAGPTSVVMVPVP